MAHMWAKFKRGVRTAAKVAGAVGAVALAVHGIHKGAATRPYIQSVSECNKKPQKLVCILLVSQSELFR